MKLMLSIVAVLALGPPVVTLTGDSALVVPAQQIHARLAAMVPQAAKATDAGAVLANYGHLSLRLYVRTHTGGGEMHAHFDDLMIVEKGSATLVTGGALADRKDGANGESHGLSVENGVARKISAGDVVVIPAGVPHQLIIPPGVTFEDLSAKIKEP